MSEIADLGFEQVRTYEDDGVEWYCRELGTLFLTRCFPLFVLLLDFLSEALVCLMEDLLVGVTTVNVRVLHTHYFAQAFHL